MITPPAAQSGRFHVDANILPSPSSDIGGNETDASLIETCWLRLAVHMMGLFHFHARRNPQLALCWQSKEHAVPVEPTLFAPTQALDAGCCKSG